MTHINDDNQEEERSLDTVPETSDRRQRGATAIYVAGRERVLGRRVVLLLADPAEDAQRLAEALGGRQIAARWVHDMVDALEPRHAAWDHPDDCELCRTTTQRLAPRR